METKDIIVYHNPRCSKSRNMVDELAGRDIDFTVFEYLKEDLNVAMISDVLAKLQIEPIELMRKGESDFKEQIKGKELSNEQLIQKMVEFPKLIERPIVIRGEKAIIGRPLENINKLL